MRFLLLSAAAAALVGTPVFAQVTPTHANIAYGSNSSRQVLDIYLPGGAAAGPRPAVFWYHGGGWRSGDKSSAAERAPLLLERGIAVISINYRYSSEAVFPAQIHDCKGAMRWLRANAAAYNIDPDRIGVWGASAGGHLAALMATSGGVAGLEGTVGGNAGRSSRAQAAVDYYGHTDFFAVHPQQAVCGTAESRLFGFGVCLSTIQENRDDPAFAPQVAVMESAGARTHVTPDDPPMRIVHGLADMVVIPLHSELLRDAMMDVGAEVTATFVPGVGHDLGLGQDQATADLLARWLSHPTCTADWNNDGTVNSGDISSFLTIWLRSLDLATPGGDFDGSGTVNSGDISAYLTAWLAQVGGC